MCRALELAETLYDSIEDIENEWEELRRRVSVADKKVMDVEHYIEISDNLNASQGYEAYRMLKEVLEERRVVKDEIDEIRPLHIATSSLSKSGRGKLRSSITKTRKRILDEDEVRIYNVRVMTDIFGETIKQN